MRIWFERPKENKKKQGTQQKLTFYRKKLLTKTSLGLYFYYRLIQKQMNLIK